MKCPNCGGKIDKGDVFCQGCGYQIPQKKAGSKVVILAPLIFLVVGMICIFALLFRTSDEMQDEKAKEKTAESTEEIFGQYETSEENEVQDENLDPEDITTEDPVGNVQDFAGEEKLEYILGDSDSRYLTEADVASLSLREINYAKNEIYARHGRRFTSPELQNYFNSKDWYEGIYDPGDFDANYSARLLNDYEKRNAEFLSEMEYSIDSRGYQLDQ